MSYSFLHRIYEHLRDLNHEVTQVIHNEPHSAEQRLQALISELRALLDRHGAAGGGQNG